MQAYRTKGILKFANGHENEFSHGRAGWGGAVNQLSLHWT